MLVFICLFVYMSVYLCVCSQVVSETGNLITVFLPLRLYAKMIYNLPVYIKL